MFVQTYIIHTSIPTTSILTLDYCLQTQRSATLDFFPSSAINFVCLGWWCCWTDSVYRNTMIHMIECDIDFVLTASQDWARWRVPGVRMALVHVTSPTLCRSSAVGSGAARGETSLEISHSPTGETRLAIYCWETPLIVSCEQS